MAFPPDDAHESLVFTLGTDVSPFRPHMNVGPLRRTRIDGGRRNLGPHRDDHTSLKREVESSWRLGRSERVRRPIRAASLANEPIKTCGHEPKLVDLSPELSETAPARHTKSPTPVPRG